MSFSNTDGLEEAKFQYISIIDTLKLVLSNQEVMDYVKSDKKCEDDEYVRNFEDAETYKTHPFFKKYLDAFGIHLYSDEFLVNNPLGTKTHSQKILAFYFTIGTNLPPHLRDFLGNVHVLAFAFAKDVAKYGMNKLLTPFYLDLQRLESDKGVNVLINNKEHTLRATLLTVCADTLAAHEVLGFMAPSATYFCRLCMMSRNDRKTCPHIFAQLRTREMHKLHVKAVESNTKARSECGVKFDTILNKLRYFHCTENYSMAIMHDVLEGQAHFDLKLVLNKFMDLYKINIPLLNERIESFNYGRKEVKNKPSATLSAASIRNITTEHKLQERAAQMWCLLRIFPFLVSDLVLSDDPYLQHLINLNRINEYIFSPKLQPSNIIQLRALIHDYIVNFGKLFPNENAINKLHHMDHFAMCIEKSGPLRHLSCFKYEARHQIFKKYGSICCNFKNIIVSMANVSQMTQCSIWGTKRSEIRRRLEENASAEIQIEIDANTKEVLVMKGIEIDESIKLVPKIGVYGIQYAINSFVVYDCDPENLNMPIFGKIEKIILKNNEVYLYCKKYGCLYLSEGLNAYCVEEQTDFDIVRIDELSDSKPFSLWSDFSDDKQQYICLRHLV